MYGLEHVDPETDAVRKQFIDHILGAVEQGIVSFPVRNTDLFYLSDVLLEWAEGGYCGQ